MKPIALASVALLLAGCSCPGTSGNPDGSTLPDGGNPDGGNGLFAYTTIDAKPVWQANPFAMAVSATDHVGIAYFVMGDGGVLGATLLPDGGTGQAQTFQNVDIRYVEWTAAGGASAPQTLTTVQESGVRGISVAFQPNGQPAVSYLGGPNKTTTSTGGAIPGGANPYWFQQNAMLNRRLSDGVTWQETMVDDYSLNVLPTNQGNTGGCLYNGVGPDSNVLGVVLGLYPSLAIDPAGNAYLAYRDVHQAQFPIQDWQGSDLKMAKVPPTWTSPVSAGSFCHSNPPQGGCNGVAWGGSAHGAEPGFGGFGGHNDLVLGLNGLPAIVSDQIQGSPTGLGLNVLFFQEVSSAPWNCANTNQVCSSVVSPTPWLPVYCQGSQLIETDPNTDTGASLAWDAPADGGVGYGLAYVDKNAHILYFTQSADGTSWAAADTALGQGIGGLNPSLALDPVYHEPHIAYFYCTGAASPPCNAPSGSLNGANIQIIQRVAGGAGGWQPLVVDPQGAANPKLAFLSNDKRVVVYELGDGSIRLALEQ